MLAPATTHPPCFATSYFLPGDGPCETGCRLAQDCRAAYLVRSGEALAGNPAALSADERVYVLSHRPHPHLVALPCREAAEPEVTTPAPATKTPRAKWTADHRRPLASFTARSVPALVAEVLRIAAQPLHVRDIAAEALSIAAARGVRIGGKTPEATVGLALRQVLEIERVGRGRYCWRAAPAA